MPTALVDWRADLLDLQEDLVRSHRNTVNGRMGVLVTAVLDLREQAEHDRARTDARFDQVDARFDQVDARFDQVESDLVEVKSDLAEVKSDVAGLKSDMVEVKSELAEVVRRTVEIPKMAAGIEELRRWVAWDEATGRKPRQ